MSIPDPYFEGRRDRPSRAVRVARLLALLGACVAATCDPQSARASAGVPGASVNITRGGAINASTYNTSSFEVLNTSGGGTRITRLRIDLSTALLPDLVFDPNGVAGDTVAKCFTADVGATLVGLVPPVDPCLTPFAGPHDDGYDTLQIDFTSFASSRSFSFSVDVDPTSIRGAAAPGPGESGSVSGLELTGATVEVTFDSGVTLAGPCFRAPASDGSCVATLTPTPPAAPGLVILGVMPPATVLTAGQTARVTGPAGAQVAILQVEAALFTAGLEGGGFDIDPFEANSALVVGEQDAAIGLSGSVDIPLVLTRSDPDGGLNHLVAVVRAPSGETGALSPVLVLDYDDCTAPPPRSVTLAVDATTLSWTPLPGAVAYDVVKGDLDLLRSGRSFTPSVLACLADELADTSIADAAQPAPGEAFYYLVRGVGCGGNGTWDDGAGTGQTLPRDAAIDAAPASCP